MSVTNVNNAKGEKSKKFQSLNINNLYQGSASKPLARSAPQKHGLQSLGKVPLARKAPANLPSLKAEHSGNDPGIPLVPSGGGGWAGKDGTSGNDHGNPTNIGGVVSKKVGAGVGDPGDSVTSSAGRGLINSGGKRTLSQQLQPHGGGDLLLSSASHLHHSKGLSSNEPKTWSSLSQGGIKGSKSFLNQGSPLFGQEFPSLTDQDGASSPTKGEARPQPPSANQQQGPNGNGGGGSLLSKTADETNLPNGNNASKGGGVGKYGPGPCLRPQSHGNWLHGGGAPKSTSGRDETSVPDKPPAMPQFDVSTTPSKIQQPLLHMGPPKKVIHLESRQTQQHRPPMGGPAMAMGLGGRRGGPPPPPSAAGAGRDSHLFSATTIIDTEKLKRMDYLEGGGATDDWTKNDDNFDYNKTLRSDDDDDGESSSAGASSTWQDYRSAPPTSVANQRLAGQNQTNSSSVANFHNANAPAAGSFHSSHGPPGRGGQQHQMHAHEANARRVRVPEPTVDLSGGSGGNFFDDEEERRNKKKEEVLKNIERARKRREEEENKYKFDSREVGDYGRGQDRYHMRGGKHQPPRTMEPKSNFGKFDVVISNGSNTSSVGPPSKGNSPSKYEASDLSPHRLGGSSQGSSDTRDRSSSSPSGTPPVQQQQQTYQQPLAPEPAVPTGPQRFKRHGGELLQSANLGPKRNPSKDSESQSQPMIPARDTRQKMDPASKPKDYGALFRSEQSGNMSPSSVAGRGRGRSAQQQPSDKETSLERDQQQYGGSGFSADESSDSEEVPYNNHRQQTGGNFGMDVDRRSQQQRVGHHTRQLSEEEEEDEEKDKANEQEKELTRRNHNRSSGRNMGSYQESTQPQHSAQADVTKRSSNHRGGNNRHSGSNFDYENAPRSKDGSGNLPRDGSNRDQRHGKNSNGPANASSQNHRTDRDGKLSRNAAAAASNGSGATTKGNASTKNQHGQMDKKTSGNKSQQVGGSNPRQQQQQQQQRGRRNEIEDFEEGHMVDDKPTKSGNRNQQTSAPVSQVVESDRDESIQQQQQHSQSQGKDRNNGWFVPRGQPSRRGRGGATSRGGRNAHQQPPGEFEEDMDGGDSNPVSGDEHEQVSRDESRRGGKSLQKSHRENMRGGKKQQQQRGGNDHDSNEYVSKDEFKGGRDSAERGAPPQRHANNGMSGNKFDYKQQPQQPQQGPPPRSMDRGLNSGGFKIGLGGPSGPPQQQQQQPFERRSSKLPPRLAKQREQNRMAQKGRGGMDNMGPAGSGGWSSGPSDGNGNLGMEKGSYSNWNNDTEELSNMLENLGSDGNPVHHGHGQQLPQTGMDLTSHQAMLHHQQQQRKDMGEGDAPVQTIIFENTNFKEKVGGAEQQHQRKNNNPATGFQNDGGQQQHPSMSMGGLGGGFSNAPHHSQSSHRGKPGEDSADLKLDFAFEPDMSNMDDGKMTAKSIASAVAAGINPAAVAAAAVAVAGGHPDQDLNMKIASVKKVWEVGHQMSGMPPPSSVSSGAFQSGFASEDGAGSMGGPNVSMPPPNTGAIDHDSAYDKHDGSKRQHQQQHSQQMQQHQSGGQPHMPAHQANEYDQQHHQRRQQQQQQQQQQAGMAFNRLGLSTLHSPPSFPNQPHSLYQAFQLDGRGVTNPFVPYPTGLGGQSVLLPSSAAGTAGDLFNANAGAQAAQAAAAANQFRIQSAAGAQFAAAAAVQAQAQAQAQAGNPQQLSQQNLMGSTAMKQQPSNQIGPIGTKGGSSNAAAAAAQFTQGGLNTLPSHLIQYDNSGTPYLPNALQRSAAAASGQTAFYQALASSQQGGNNGRQQNPYGLQGFQAAVSQAGMQHLSNSAAVAAAQMQRGQQQATMSFMKQQQGQQQQQSQQKRQQQQQGPPPSVAQQSQPGPDGNSMMKGLATDETFGRPSVGVSSPATKRTAANAAGVQGGSQTGKDLAATYNPTPIQRPQGSTPSALQTGDDAGNGSKDKRQPSEEATK